MTQSKRAGTAATTLEGGCASDGNRAQRFWTFGRAQRVPPCRIIPDALDAYLTRQAIAGREPHQSGGTTNSRSEQLAAPLPSDIAADPPPEQDIT
jgi:hypothetical protein